nr:hypothetical protein [Tanacetum cinerariifolium]GFA06645.1 hypothetical protein [Tanacetum cinerariifolium]
LQGASLLWGSSGKDDGSRGGVVEWTGEWGKWCYGDSGKTGYRVNSGFCLNVGGDK